MEQPALVDRKVAGVIRERMAAFRVVVLHGARQTGKTTLARQLTSSGSFVSLDDEAQYDASVDDPRTFIEIRNRPVVIDEVQRGGDALVRAIKAAVDDDAAAGSFLLTGSANFLTIPHLSESLAGRATFVDLFPLSETEREGTSGLLAELVDARADPSDAANGRELGTAEDRVLAGRGVAVETPRDYVDRIVRGGYPALIDMPANLRSVWFRDYLRAVIARDIQELTGARKVDELPRLLEALAGRTASALVIEDLRRDLGFGSRETVADYLAHLQMLYLMHLLPGWATSVTTRARRRSKLFLSDTGLAVASMRLDADRLLDPAERTRGSLFETFVVNELVKQASFLEDPVSLSHFRSGDGRREIDVMIETADRRLFGVEIKTSRSIKPQHYRTLQWMRDRVGAGFTLGIVLYCGEVSYRLAERIVALPISSLWSR